MERIIGDGEWQAIHLSGEEAQTVHFALGLLIRRLDIKIDYIQERAQEFNMLAAIEDFEEMQKQLTEGDYILCTKEDMFIAHWSLGTLWGYHNWSLYPLSGYEHAAQDVGLRPAEMFGHATNAMKLLEVIPTPEPEYVGV